MTSYVENGCPEPSLNPPEEQTFTAPFDIEMWANGGWDLWTRVDEFKYIYEEVDILREHGFSYRVYDINREEVIL